MRERVILVQKLIIPSINSLSIVLIIIYIQDMFIFFNLIGSITYCLYTSAILAAFSLNYIIITFTYAILTSSHVFKISLQPDDI